MLKVGDIVKLKNPKNKREAKRRWRVIYSWTDDAPLVAVRRLDTIIHSREELAKNLLTPISFWERIISLRERII